MIYFKDETSELLFAYENENVAQKHINTRMVRLSESDINLMVQSASGIDDERAWRDSELVRSDIELNKVQDSDPKATGSVSDWRLYRKMLRAWPENKNFPDRMFRPTAPDYKE